MLALRWIDPWWEFDCPAALLVPVLRFYEGGETCDKVFEDTVISACVDGYLRDHSNIRQYNILYLKRIARQVLAGKKFPKKQVWAEEREVEFILDKDGQLKCSYWP
jgi:hypothetical protein